MSALKRAVEIVANGNQTHFAKRVTEEVDRINKGSTILPNPIPALTQQMVHHYLKNNKPCAAHHAPIISNLTGNKVTCHQLRPDVYPMPEDKAA